MRTRIKTLINKGLHKFGLEISRLGTRDPHVRPYLSQRGTVRAAAAAGMSVRDYVETTGDERGVTQGVIDQLATTGIFRDPPRRILEVGTGTGKFASRIQSLFLPERYESYEPDRRWARWLAGELGITSLPSDGYSLRHTADGSIDLAMAHGVFLYLPLLTACRYFSELGRVVRAEGWVTFDIHSEACFGDAELDAWIKSGQQWPTILPRDFVVNQLGRHGCRLQSEFFSRPGLWKTHYLVFRKESH